MKQKDKPLLRITGRGSPTNTDGRFESISHEGDLSDYGWVDAEEESSLLKTQFFEDHSKTIVTENDSPDIGFQYSLNAYRGCEHGCAYCYARPTHEYLGYSAGLDFESKIFVKLRAAELLRKKFLTPSWKGDLIVMSGITDCYQPAERKYRLTRQCLEVMAEFRNPAYIITKNQLVQRDIDILQELAKYNAIGVTVSVTSLDPDLARKLEPRTSTPKARLATIKALAEAGIPVSVNVAPTIPGLTDQEMPAILKAAAEAGATGAGFVPVRLPYSVKEIFQEWLQEHFPERANKVLNAIKSIRGGKLNVSEFGSRMRGSGVRADHISHMFSVFTKKYGLNQRKSEKITSEHFRKVTDQYSLFD
jgi:DNA repair photolyase